MKNILLSAVVLLIAATSNSASAKEVQKLKHVVISFSENDAESRLPASVEEKAVVEAQARHVAKDRSLDEAIENLF